MLKSYKYRIYPDLNQQTKLNNMFGCCRFVYNLGLETKISAYIGNKINLTCFDLNKQITDLKKDLLWLKECPAQSLQQSMNSLDNAYTKFYKGKGFPKYKKKNCKQSIKFAQYVDINFKTNKIKFQRLDEIDIIIDRKFKGDIKTVTVSKTVTNKYFVSILVDNKKELPVKKEIKLETSVGIDFGIKDLCILSDGTKFFNPKYTKKYQDRLKIEQRKLERCQRNLYKFVDINGKEYKKHSNNYYRQKLKVALIHEKIKNSRIDNLHKVSSSIIKNYDTICLENLDVKSMMSKMKPIQNESGKFIENGQRNKSNLNRQIQDVAWGELKRQLVYKAEWTGNNIIEIGQFEPSSKLCSKCGFINKQLKLEDREWICPKCLTKHDRDQNAATNIQTIGLKNKI